MEEEKNYESREQNVGVAYYSSCLWHGYVSCGDVGRDNRRMWRMRRRGGMRGGGGRGRYTFSIAHTVVQPTVTEVMITWHSRTSTHR